MVAGTVLVVEHETPVRAYLEQQLADDGFDVLATDRAAAALELVERAKPNLVLLDAVLPDGSGFEVCGRLREGAPGRAWDRDVPVIMVSARGDPVDRVRGFARGCDDYVVRPFIYDELVARMRAVLRRSTGPRHAHLTVRDLEIDLAARIVTVGGEQVQLSAKEYELLVALAEDPVRVFKKEDLLRDVWGFRSLGRTRTLDSHASRLRRKLNRNGDACYVLNVWGVGYRLTAVG
ncbi:MAG TPA: response regulator transcription factor [Gaiellaceae bacterium]|nr:response regulator transcription factor [Gaiellaceae bacterium]